MARIAARVVDACWQVTLRLSSWQPSQARLNVHLLIRTSYAAHEPRRVGLRGEQRDGQFVNGDERVGAELAALVRDGAVGDVAASFCGRAIGVHSRMRAKPG